VSVGGTWRDTNESRLARWMLFVDGENFTIRAERHAANTGLNLQEGPYYSPDSFVWMPRYKGYTNIYGSDVPWELQPRAIRANYYASVWGDAPKVFSVREALWNLGFQPKVFKKIRRDEKAKGVDIRLTTDLLVGAYRDIYDVAVLITGDGDYVPLVEEVKGLGKLVYVAFIKDKPTAGLSSELCLASDVVPSEFERTFRMMWKSYRPNN